MRGRLLRIGANSKKISFRSLILLFTASIITFASAMPDQVVALGVFDQNSQPKSPSVLKTEVVNSAKTQAIRTGDSTPPPQPQRKPDRTIVREDVSKRTAFSSSFINKDGTRTLQYSSVQKNFKKGVTWEKINNEITQKDVVNPPTKNWIDVVSGTSSMVPAAEVYTGEAGVIKTTMKPFREGIEISFGAKKLTMKPVDAENVKPEQKDDRTIIYRNAWPGVDAEYQLRGETVKEVLVVKNKNAKTDFDFIIEGGKLYTHPTRAGELAIEGVDPAEFSFSALTLDVNGKGVISEQRVAQTPTHSGLSVSLDQEWVRQQPAESFPMMIDPSFYRYNDQGYMFKSDGYSCSHANCHFNVGTLHDGSGWKHWRSYFMFNYAEAAGKNLIDASLQMPMAEGINGEPGGRYVYMRWANCISFQCVGQGPYAESHVGSWADLDITEVIRPHLAAASSGAWFGLWGEEGPWKSYKPFYEMHINVVYDNPTPIPVMSEPGHGQVIAATDPTLRVNPVSDPDGPVLYDFVVSTNSDGSGTVIRSGATGLTQWTVPEGVLQDGTTYYWRVEVKDSNQYAQPSVTAIRPMKIDLRTGKDSTQAYDTVGPIGIDLATGNATTSASTHTINALGGSIGLNLEYNTPSKSKTGLLGEYWNVTQQQTAPQGEPSLKRYEQDVNFTWPSGQSPGPAIHADWFAARWSGFFVAPNTGAYQFGASHDDSMAITVNGQTFSGCYGDTPCYNGGSINLQAGQVVPITINYTETTGNGYARMYVKGAVPEQPVPRDWLRTKVEPPVSQYGLNGRYYTNDGNHVFPSNPNDPARLMMARTDNKLSFQWGNNGPATGLRTDNFMVKWTGYITVPEAETYTLGALTDDGVRISLNTGLLGAPEQVLNSWSYTPNETWGTPKSLPANTPIPITIEYYEAGYGANFSLRIKGPGLLSQGEEIPINWLTPKASAVPGAWQLGVDVDGDVAYERLRVVGQNIILEDSTRATHEYTWTGSGYKPPVNKDGQLTRNLDNTYRLLDSDGRTYTFDAEGKLTSLTTPTDDRNPASLKYEYAGDPSRLVKISDGVTESRWGKPIYKGVNDSGQDTCPTSSQQASWLNPNGFDGSAPEGMLCAFKTSDGDITKFFYVNKQLSRIEKPGGELTDYGYDEYGRISSTRDSIAADAVAASIRTDNETVFTQVAYDELGRASAVKAPASSVNASRVNHTFEYQTSGLVPMYRQLGPNGDHRTSITPVLANYHKEYQQGWLFTSQKPGTHALYSCQIGWDEFISTLSNCEGYTMLGLIGFAYSAPPADVPTTPILRCTISGEHFVSTTTNCEGYYNEGIHGYIVTSPSTYGATQMHIDGTTEPHGFSKRVEYDNLWRTNKETDVANLSSKTEWDSTKDLELSKTDPTGLKSTTIYDDEDRPIEAYGPAPAAWYETSGQNIRRPLAAYSSQVPKTTTGYDEGLIGPEVTYFNYKADNKTLVGTPKLRTNGLADANGAVATPGVMMKVWGANRPITPDAGMSGWGLRANGKLRVPANGNYTFHFWHDDGIRVYLDDTVLAEDWNNGGYRRLDATRTLEAGKAYRIMVEYYDADNNATLDLFVSAPNAALGGNDRDWSTELKPGFGLKTNETAYDAQLGNVTTKTTYAKPEYGLVDKTILDPTGLNLQTTATYETPGTGFLRQTSKTLPGGGTTQYQHYTATDTRDNPCTTDVETIHQGGRPKGKIEADPDGPGPQTPRTSETIYNASGEVVATRYNNDAWTCTEYDTRGRVQRTLIPALGSKPSRTITNDYAKDGNPLVTTTTDNQGTIRVENDLLGRTVKYTDVHGKVTENTYDIYGKLTSRTSPIGTESYEYDTYDRLTKHKLDGVTFATVTYDQYSRIANVQYPAGISLSNITRDTLGRENSTSFMVNGQQYTDSIERYVSGDIKQGTENGVSKQYTYDKAGRLTGATIGSNTFNYEFGTPDLACNSLAGNNPNTAKNGNRTKLTMNGQTTTYCYDMADRLIASSDATLTDALYDSHGNTTSLGDATHKTEFGYDVTDRNTSIKSGTKETVFARDVQDRIIGREQKNNGVSTSNVSYSFTGSGDSPDALLDGSGNVIQKYVSLPGDVLVTIKPNSQSAGATTYSLPNIHGDVFATINADGALLDTFMTGPFGEVLLNQPASPSGALVPMSSPTNTADGTTWNYVGQHQKITDLETSSIAGGIIQMGARPFISKTGRFLGIDKIEGGVDNGYVYPPNPVNNFDLSGEAKSKGKQPRSTNRSLPLSAKEQQALNSKMAGKRFDPKLLKSAKKKLNTMKKFEGTKNIQKRANLNRSSPKSLKGGGGAMLWMYVFPVHIFERAFPQNSPLI